MHNEEKTFRFSMRKPFEYKNFLEEKERGKGLIAIEGLKSYRTSNRRCRNRRIGDPLKELHLTEGRNTGFQNVPKKEPKKS